jgi:hypothetical protein
MNHTLAVAQKELVEKRFVFAAPAAAALVVLLLPLAPRVPANSWQSIYVVGSAIFAVAFGLGLAAVLGATTIGRELTERRLSFYFAKPLAAPAIWFGKLIAVVLLVVSSFAIAMIPAFFAGTKAIRAVWAGEGRNFVALVAILATLFFFVAHMLSTIARARTAWAFVDLLLMVVVGWVGWSIVQPLLMHMALEMLILLLQIFAWLMLIAVVATGVWQLSRGRTDKVQSHRAMSQFLWPCTAGALAVCAAIVWWVVSATPSDLTGIDNLELSPAGNYFVIAGKAVHRRDYVAQFLIDKRNGAYTRLGAVVARDFTPDGSKMFEIRPIIRRSVRGEVVIRDLVSGGEVSTGLTTTPYASMVFTNDATRVAYVEHVILSIYDVPTKTSIGTKRLPFESPQAMWFATPDILRIYAADVQKSSSEPVLRTLHMYEYVVSTKTFRETGAYQKTDRNLFFTANQDGTRLFVRRGDGGADVVDAVTGAVLLTVDGTRVASFTDGRLAVLKGSTVRILTREGAVAKEIAIDNAPDDYVALRAMSGSKILVFVNPRLDNGKSRVFVADANTGAIVRREEGISPAMSMRYYGGDLRQVELAPEPIIADRDRDFLRWNPITNEKTVLVDIKKKT